MVFFKKAESARPAGGVVSCQPLLKEVPGDGEAAARPPEAVDIPAQGCPGLLLSLLLHIMLVAIVSLPERPSSQASVGLLLVVVARVSGGDSGLVDHSWSLALARQGAGWLVLAVAALLDRWGRPALGNHLGIVLCQNLCHILHRPVAHFDRVGVEGASQGVARGEALGNDAHEDLWDVGGAVLGEGRVEPGDAALPVVPPHPHLLLLHPGLVLKDKELVDLKVLVL